MSDSLEQRLRAVEDMQAVTALKAAYCDGWDRWEPIPSNRCERVLELFVEDAVWDAATYGRCEGRAQLAQAFKSMQSQPIGLHCISNPDIRIDGDRATGRWHVTLAGNQDGAAFLMIGIYDDEFIRTPSGWRFKSVRFTPACITNLPHEWISGARLQSPPLDARDK
jgi:ketosteroid isomerase-like protein